MSALLHPFSAMLAALLALQPVALQAARAQEAAAPPAPQHVADEGAYKPVDKDERGLWMDTEEGERQLKASQQVIRDPALNAYVRQVLCNLVGQAKCANVRLYIVRTPAFNASMAVNGAMVVYSGLLLRTQNEAQMAAVLGHEYTHFANHHGLRMFRQVKEKSAAAAWLAFTGIGLIASFSMAASLFSYSRDMEREADSGGLALMAAAGYDTREAAKVWEQLRAEMDATAAVRNTKSRKDKSGGIFATHPPTAERVANLAAMARESPGNAGHTGLDSYSAAMVHWWPVFFDDQLKRNDLGASDYLLAALAQQGWSPWLLYARGELYRRRAQGNDIADAEKFYTQGIEAGGALPELWRGRGLARLKLQQADAGKTDLNEYLRRAPDAVDRSMIAMMAGGTP